MKNESTLLTVESLIFSFHTYAGEVQAVRGVSFQLEKGQTLALSENLDAGNRSRRNRLYV